MNIRLLGTGGADGIPGLFANNDVSNWAREHGGKDVRSRSAALVDGHLKIDLGPDTLSQMQRYGLRGTDWTALLFTHSHEDHVDPGEIQYALYPFVNCDHLEFTIYANTTICELIRARYPDWPMEIVETRSFLTYHHGPYRITPIAATHTQDEDCQNLIIERKGKTLLYATDSGIYREETYEFLKHIKVDCMIVECTEGFNTSKYYGHLDLKTCVQQVERLRNQGTVRPDTKVITTHHAHTGGARHCDLERVLPSYGMEPGYDGMFVEF